MRGGSSFYKNHIILLQRRPYSKRYPPTRRSGSDHPQTDTELHQQCWSRQSRLMGMAGSKTRQSRSLVVIPACRPCQPAASSSHPHHYMAPAIQRPTTSRNPARNLTPENNSSLTYKDLLLSTTKKEILLYLEWMRTQPTTMMTCWTSSWKPTWWTSSITWFFNARPPTYSQAGSQQIDILAGSLEVFNYMMTTFTLDPNHRRRRSIQLHDDHLHTGPSQTIGEGDHSKFGGNLNFIGLINCDDIRWIERPDVWPVPNTSLYKHQGKNQIPQVLQGPTRRAQCNQPFATNTPQMCNHQHMHSEWQMTLPRHSNTTIQPTSALSGGKASASELAPNCTHPHWLPARCFR